MTKAVTKEAPCVIVISALRSHANANLNRGEDGRPKTCTYGGVQRAAVSSQSWKFAIRNSELLKDVFTKYSRSIRTRAIDVVTADNVLPNIKENDKKDLMAKIIPLYYGMKDTNTLRVYTKDELACVANRAVTWAEKTDVKEIEQHLQALEKISAKSKSKNENEEDGKKSKEIYKPLDSVLGFGDVYGTGYALDVILGGKMLESGLSNETQHGTDGATYTAFAISTHIVKNDVDFFSAVDEFKSTGGSAYLDANEMNSAVMYYSQVIDLEALRDYVCDYLKVKGMKDTVGEAIVEIMKAYMKTVLTTVPQGKQHSNASMEAADVMCIELSRSKNACTHVAAFEKPVQADANGGFLAPSILALRDRIDADERSSLDEEPVTRFWYSTNTDLEFKDATNTVICKTAKELVSKAIAAL